MGNAILSEQKRTIKQAANSLSLTEILDYLLEECGELIVAIQHRKRNRIPESDYILELIHVQIMIEQALEKVDFEDYQVLLVQQLLRLDERTKNRNKG